MACRACGDAESAVNLLVSSATYPPGEVRSSDLMMKWLWMECWARLWASSQSLMSPKGTLPTLATNALSGTAVSANDSLRIWELG